MCIYFPDFCAIILERFRKTEAEDDDFRKTVFKVIPILIQGWRLFLPQHMCGTEPFPKDFRARKYKVERHFLTKVEIISIS